MSSKLRTKYKAHQKCETFYTGNHLQISKDCQDILCDNGSDIKFLNVTSGQPSSLLEINNENKTLGGFVGLNSEEDSEDTFKNASISADEGDVVTSMLLSPDGTKLIVAYKSLRLRLYDCPSRALKLTFLCYHLSPVCCLAWDASSTLVITGAADGSARVWDTSRNVCTHAIKGAPGVFGCSTFHPNLHAQPLLYAGVNNTLYVWNLHSDCSYDLKLQNSDAHHLKITCLLTTKDGKSLLSLGLDRVAILWDAINLSQKVVAVVGQAVSGAILLPLKKTESGVKVLLGGESGYLSIWHLDKNAKEEFKTENRLVTPPQGEENTGLLAIKSILPAEALNSVLVTTYDKNVLFLKTDDFEPWKLLCGNNDEILSTIVVTVPQDQSPENDDVKQLIIAATNSSEIRVYDMSNFNCKLLRGHTAIVLSLARHPSISDVFASCSHDFSVRLWHTTPDCDAVCIGLATGHSQSVASVAFGVNMLLSCGQDQCIKQWNLPQDILQYKTDDNKKDILGNGKDISPDKLQCTFTQVGHEKHINSIAVSRKDEFIATGSRDKTVKLWNGKDLSLLKTLSGHKRGIWCVQFSPVDRVLASASADGTICVWSLQTLTLITKLEGHDCSVVNLQWMTNGLQLASTSADGALKVWELKTKLCLDTFNSHDSESKVWGLDCCEDGGVLVSGGEDGRIVVWRDITEELAKEEAKEVQRIQSEKQTVSNLLHAERWEEALRLTLRYSQPHNSMKAIQGILFSTGEESLGNIINTLAEGELANLIQYLTKWISKASHCFEAITILNMLVCTKLPEELIKLPFWESSIEVLLSYSTKHLDRVTDMNQAVGLLEYCTQDVAHNLLGPITKPMDAIDAKQLLNELLPNDVAKKNGTQNEFSDDDEDDTNINVEELDADYEKENIVVSEDDEDGNDDGNDLNIADDDDNEDDWNVSSNTNDDYKTKRNEKTSRDYEPLIEEQPPSRYNNKKFNHFGKGKKGFGVNDKRSFKRK